MNKIFLIFFCLFFVALSRKLMIKDEDLEEQEILQKINDLPLPDLNRSINVKPVNLNFNIREHSYNDTVLNLDMNPGIKLRFKVHNAKYLPFFD